MKTKLTGKWALVTGSSRGIGQQIAIGLAQLNCNIILHGRTPENTLQTREKLKAFDIQIHTVAGDLSTPEGIQSVINGVNAGPGYVDILYNNAAISCNSTPVFEFDLNIWQQVFQVNVFAVTELCKAFGPGMKQRNWGRIINVTSGIADQPNLAPYSVSKAAVDKLTRDLAFEFKDTNVRVNCIDPGWIRTDLGGPNAWDAVESVLPGMLAPVIIDDKGPNGRLFSAQDYKYFD